MNIQNQKIDSAESNIPVIIDAERNIDGQPMLRCMYCSIQSDEPISYEILNSGIVKYPIVMLHLEAIITGTDYFKSAEEIDEMYFRIEENDMLFVDINDIWIPKNWFQSNLECKQGDVFRMSQKSFSLCWSFRNDRISIEELGIKADQSFKGDDTIIQFSEVETKAYKEWTANQIEESRKQYKKNRNQSKTLKKRN